MGPFSVEERSKPGDLGLSDMSGSRCGVVVEDVLEVLEGGRSKVLGASNGSGAIRSWLEGGMCVVLGCTAWRVNYLSVC